MYQVWLKCTNFLPENKDDNSDWVLGDCEEEEGDGWTVGRQEATEKGRHRHPVQPLSPRSPPSLRPRRSFSAAAFLF